jgi:hypothetical protein
MAAFLLLAIGALAAAPKRMEYLTTPAEYQQWSEKVKDVPGLIGWFHKEYKNQKKLAIHKGMEAFADRYRETPVAYMNELSDPSIHNELQSKNLNKTIDTTFYGKRRDQSVMIYVVMGEEVHSFYPEDFSTIYPNAKRDNIDYFYNQLNKPFVADMEERSEL